MSLESPEPFSMYEAATEPNPSGKTLLLLGEAPGEEEALRKKPFVGSSGHLLNALLESAGFRRQQFHITNVFSKRPPNNELLKEWTVTKTDLKRLGYSDQGRLPQHSKRYLLPEREPELMRLRHELSNLKPDLIIALGGTALWALTGDSRITQSRGSFFTAGTTIGPLAEPCFNATCLATFHPAMILRQWDQRPIVWADLLKCRRFLDGSLPAPVSRKLWINPTFDEMAEVYFRFHASNELLGVDIETSPSSNQITTIAFATTTEGICIPIWNKDTRPDSACYWPTAEEEAQAWQWIIKFAQLPNPKALQNGLYDMQYLLDTLDIRLVNVVHDTAILQHSLQPELPKALGTLASLYLNEPAWKFMRESNKDAKADE
jgi:uracil-DNA glycosylase